MSVLRQVIESAESAPPPVREKEESIPPQLPKTAPSLPIPATSDSSKLVPGHAGHLKILVENAPISMAMFDSQMRYLLANRRWIEDFKLQSQDIIGKSQYEVFPSLHPGWRHVYERALQGQVVRSDRDAVTRDGQRIVYRWEVRPWRNMDTTVGGVMITCERINGTAAAAASATPAPAPATPEANKVEPPPMQKQDAFWQSTLPIVSLDEEGCVLKASTGAAEIFLSAGLREGSTPFWQLFGERIPNGPLHEQILAAVRLALRQSSQVPLHLSIDPAATEGAPSFWHLSAMDGTEWGTPGRVVLAIGAPLPEIKHEEKSVAEPAAEAEAPAAAAPALAPVAAPVDTAPQHLAEEIARLRLSLKEACDHEMLARHREARLRSVLDVLPVGMLVLDERGRPIYHNAQLSVLLGRPIMEGQTVENWLSLCCRDERHTDEVIRQWREGVWRKQATRTLALAASDGLLKDIELSPAQLAPGGFVVVFRDVTENRRLDEMLRSTEAKLRTLVHENPMPVILSDRAGGVFDANPAAEELLGYSRGELRRMPMDLWLRPESFALRTNALREMTQRGDRSAVVSVEVEAMGGRRELANMKLSTVPDPFGSPLFTIHFLELLRPEPEPVPAPVAVEPEIEAEPPAPVRRPVAALLTTDSNGRIATWEPAAELLFGYLSDEAVGKGLHSFFRPSDASGFYYELQQMVQENPEPITLEWRFYAKGGGKDEAMFTIEGVPDVGGSAVSLWVGNPAEPAEDTDATHAPESFLLDDENGEVVEEGSPVHARPTKADLKRERLLIGETHHRVKNHLQIITSMLNLQMSTVHNDEAKDALRSSQNRVRSIAALHQHLYQMASGEATNFPDFAAGLIEHLRQCYDAGAERVAINLDLSNADVPEEWLMPLALSLNEMVSNALKHAFPSDRSGILNVSLNWGEERGELVVEDNGVGLPEDFESLQTTGLGLKILRVFAGQLGGEVVISGALEEGARFMLRFPLATATAVAESGSTAAPSQEASQS